MVPDPRHHRRRGFYGAENKAALSREFSSGSSGEYQDGDPSANSAEESEGFSSRASGPASTEQPLRRRNPSTSGDSGSGCDRPDPTEQLAQAYRDLIGDPYLEDEGEENFSSEVAEAASSRVEEPAAPPSPDTEPFPEFEDVDPEEWYSSFYPPGQGFRIDSSPCPPGVPWLQPQQEATPAHNQASHRQPCLLPAPNFGSPLPIRNHRPFCRLQPSETRRLAPSPKFTYPESRREPEQPVVRSSVASSSPSVSAAGKPCQTPSRPALDPESPTFSSRSGEPRPPRSSKRSRDYTQRPICGTSTPLGRSRQGSESKNRLPGSELCGTPPQSSDQRRQLRVGSSPASPYPAYRFDTHRRIYDPLNFFPFDSSGSHVDSSGDRSPELSGNDKSRKSSSKSGTFSLARTLRKGSSDSSNTVVQSSEPKRKNKFKRTGSSGLASSIKKLFHPGSRKSSDDETIEDADVLGTAEVSSSNASTKSNHKQDDDFPSYHHPVSGCQAHRQPAEQQATHWADASSKACFLKAEEKRVKTFKNRRFQALTFPESYPRGELPEFHFPQQAQTVDVPSSETVSEGPSVIITEPEESLSTQVFFPGGFSVSQNNHLANMDPSRASRFLDPSSAVATITRQKAEAIRLAKEQAAAVKEMCRRAKTDVPPYEFEELIGKGAYGRVYKGRQLPSRNLVAIKVMEIDSTDYKTVRDMKDESIKDFIHEIKVMNQAKEAGAKNINMLIEAISIHSQLWVVCEYCPGGSVKTLMRATGDKLEEKFIIPIARELAVGLKAIHDAGIIHRDVKAANILIHEEGRLQICDFGVAGILQSKLDKRSTWIGTPHWMPPEMFSNRGGEAHKYGSELDVWAYGCTLFECATGNPPNAGLRERMQIGRQLTRVTPKLEGDEFSQGLKDLVSYSLNSDPATRPTMGNILEHPYIANSEEAYPTSSLSELVRIYYQWTQRGGQRISLFNPGGAAAAEIPGDNPDLDEDWNFSTTDGFERRFSIIDLDQVSATLAELEGGQTPSTAQPEHKPPEETRSIEMTPLEKANFDERVKRGAAAMEGLFDEDKPTYKYETKNDFVPIEQKPGYSDLPLRTVTDRSSVASTFIDINLGSFDSSHYAAGSASNTPFQLADADTIRANRSSLRSNRNSSEERSRPRSESEDSFYQPPSGPRPPTMDWKFPTMMQPSEDDEEPKGTETYGQTERRATRDWKFPVMTPDADDSQDTTTDDAISETIRPSHTQPPTTSFSHGGNKSIDSAGESRPSTATSTVSTTSEYDPFRFDRPPTPPTRSSSLHRTVYDTAAPNLAESRYSDESSVLEGPGPDHEEPQPAWQEKDPAVSYSQPFPPVISKPEESASTSPVTTAPSITSSTTVVESRESTSTSTTVNKTNGPAFIFPDVQPPSAESLMAGADDSVVAAELDRLLRDFNDALNVTAEAVKATNVMPRAR